MSKLSVLVSAVRVEPQRQVFMFSISKLESKGAQEVDITGPNYYSALSYSDRPNRQDLSNYVTEARRLHAKSSRIIKYDLVGGEIHFLPCFNFLLFVQRRLHMNG